MKAQAWVKPALFCACLIPLGILCGELLSDNLGANPIEEITHFTGLWALRLLLITLAISPLRLLFDWRLVRYRRLLGLYAFFYACLHFLTYLVLDQFFDWGEIARDILKRPYITVGFAALVLMLPLAVTSTHKMMQRLGKRWKPLHRLIYLISTLGILHFLWLVKADLREPSIYAGILIVLLLLRLTSLGNYLQRWFPVFSR